MDTPSALGTPRTNNATTVLLLGGGDMAREVTYALQRLAVEVHAAGREESEPALRVADSAYIVDLHDDDAVLDLIRHVNPDLVVPTLELKCDTALFTVEEEKIAKVVPNAQAVKLGARRDGYRTMAHKELGLPNGTYALASSEEDLQAVADLIGFPCVVKPILTNNNSGHGQTTCDSPDDLAAAWDSAISVMKGNAHEVMVEQYIPFDYEITILAARSVDPVTGNLATWFCEPIAHRQENGWLIESWQPVNMPSEALDNARSVAARIANKIGGRGLFAVELFVKGTDVYFSAVTPRPHDSGFVTLRSQRFSQFDLYARAILGLPLDTTLISPAACSILYGVEPESDNYSLSYDGVPGALSIPEADLQIFGYAKTKVGRRMGMGLATADTAEEARVRARSIVEAISITQTTDGASEG
ncbi:formate-dependent phosphoribosylglycinamide formyltransferase [Corynebacterium sp. zg254]|uniref:Formate-dependent phosphoribosylglycinamide formyltransferase n=1 Tax=Corynebacterium zhongnanshanii TaxID=2768834 RepID=A0ABQ6VCK5_9CORY|nr:MULTISPECIES: formate-dependent phosphoribosylglycinamide formyltransferase [Corynebacterium]KAB1550689.1 formate-dependent phosphoribosylglycinamide formyltransferase [Corynebacterium sp. 321]KAB3519895.1 formate-dependent phosphoribosylglycinamide formyltransferase [Corynebacterium zhongnanshanii]MCR5914840.1 formate-dependent phosphoribosylglycinamide formyltransferase [Corynebacterium sp. zg254]